MSKTLLIVDVQKGFINENTKHIPKLVERAQNSYKHVIVTKFYNKEKSPYRRLIKWQRFTENTEDTVLAFKPKKDALILEKSIYTCVNEEFVAFLEKNKIEEIDICGIDTDICVTKCAVDIFEINLTPIVLGYMCASHGGIEYHKFSLKILERFIGRNQVHYEA